MPDTARPQLYLAPMAGITDSAFRSLMRGYGCDVVISELVSARAILEDNPRTRWLMHFEEEERPVGIQIFGYEPEVLIAAALRVEAAGPDFIDLNLGCPVKKVVKRGGGAAMLRDPVKLADLLTRMVRALSVPLSIKIRSGWDDCSINAMECVRAAEDSGVVRVAIHGRTRAQGYNGKADWDLIGDIKARARIPIIGNGDLVSADQVLTRFEQTRCDGMMIGRGALKNPWIFLQTLERFRGKPAGDPEPRPAGDYRRLISRHLEFIRRRPATRHVLTQFRKLLGWYATGLPGAAAFRCRLFQIHCMDQVVDMAEEFFIRRRDIRPQVDWNEPFLMGGHG